MQIEKKENVLFFFCIFFVSFANDCFSSSPDLASVTLFHVEENDFIVIGTDGLWDNLPDAAILAEIKQITVSEYVKYL